MLSEIDCCRSIPPPPIISEVTIKQKVMFMQVEGVWFSTEIRLRCFEVSSGMRLEEIEGRQHATVRYPRQRGLTQVPRSAVGSRALF